MTEISIEEARRRERARHQSPTMLLPIPGGKPNGHDVVPSPFLDPESALYRRVMNDAVTPTPTLVAGLIPDRCAVVVAGAGGAGKGIVMQTLATAVATENQPYLGQACEHGRAAFFTAEERLNDLLWRQDRINRAYGINKEEIADTLVLKSLRTPDCLLWHNGKPTSLMLEFCGWVEVLLPMRVVIIDSASLVYGDEEIDRHEVSMFMRHLDLLAEQFKCTIALLTHTSRSSDGSVERMTSGSTAWVNQARAGIALLNDDGDRKLVLLKANNMPTPFEIELQWSDEGILVPRDAPGMVDRLQTKQDDGLALQEIAQAWNDPHRMPLNGAPQSPAHAVKFLQRQLGWKKHRAQDALQRLSDAGRIINARTSKGGNRATGFKPTDDDKIA
ncbi:MAG TPA: AAA family ATPase [Reyranella sp.]|nr:AAA family ATPase [Reyranella sp.]